MIRAVLDTNILISALITKKTSAPLRLYKAFTKQEFLLIYPSAFKMQLYNT